MFLRLTIEFVAFFLLLPLIVVVVVVFFLAISFLVFKPQLTCRLCVCVCSFFPFIASVLSRKPARHFPCRLHFQRMRTFVPFLVFSNLVSCLKRLIPCPVGFEIIFGDWANFFFIRKSLPVCLSFSLSLVRNVAYLISLAHSNLHCPTPFRFVLVVFLATIWSLMESAACCITTGQLLLQSISAKWVQNQVSLHPLKPLFCPHLSVCVFMNMQTNGQDYSTSNISRS